MAEQQLPPHRTQRISLTKSQLRTELGAELLSLCETVTADGKLSPDELAALRQWLDDSGDADLPAASYLREVVARVIADGQVTADEYRELYRALEAVLPPEVRRLATAARKEVETAQHAKVKAEREREREERRRDQPITSANFMVAGCRYEGRPDVIARHARVGGLVRLVRDHGNRHSENAIAVKLENGRQIGFVPEVDAEGLAPVMDGGAKCAAYMTKILSGGRSPIPVIQARFFRADSSVDVDELARAESPAGISAIDAVRRIEPSAVGPRLSKWIGWGIAVLALIAVVRTCGG